MVSSFSEEALKRELDAYFDDLNLLNDLDSQILSTGLEGKEEIGKDISFIKNIRTYSGYRYNNQEQDINNYSITHMVYFKEPLSTISSKHKLSISTDDLVSHLNKVLFNTLSVQYDLFSSIDILPVKGRPPEGRDIDLRIYEGGAELNIGDSLKKEDADFYSSSYSKLGEELGLLLEYIQENLRGYSDKVLFSNLDFNYSDNSYELILKDVNLARLGCNKNYVLQEIGFLLTDYKIQEVYKGDVELDKFKDIPIRNPLSGSYALMRDIGEFKQTKDIIDINKRNGLYNVGIQLSLNKNEVDAFSIKKEIELLIKDFEIQRGYKLNYSFEGSNKNTTDAFKNFGKASLISIFFIFIILLIF